MTQFLLLIAALLTPQPAARSASLLDYEVFKTQVQPLLEGATTWTDDPEWKILAAWAGSRPARASSGTAVRIIQTNAAGDNAHVIDPGTNTVVGIIVKVVAQIPVGHVPKRISTAMLQTK